MDFRYEDQQQREQLLTIVDRGNAEQLFAFLQGFHRKPFEHLVDVMSYTGVIDDQIDIIDCTGTRYDVTPLIIAAGKGSYEKTKILLVHGANPNKQCSTGDTALNLAVHRQKYPVVDLLLQYRANPNLYNQSGKTALHRAVVSYNEEHIHHIRALLNAGADPYIEDRNQRIPLDDAVMANRPEILDILLSHDQNLVQRSYKAAIIASRLGHDKCLEILLNYGMDPNISDRTNTIPLHVAVRSLKLSTVQLLVAHGADQNLENNRGETALSIAQFIQPDQQQNFINALIHTPQIASSTFRSYTIDDTVSYTYPILHNHQNWTLDSDEFRSRTAHNSSVQNLLDPSTGAYWCSTQSQNAWVIFDLKHHYNITGLRIIGCDNDSTPRNGHFDVSNAMNGPWLTVKDFTCLLSHGNKNDFFFPSLKTRFIRVFILDNYGGEDIRIQSISFYGVDMRLINLLREYKLENSLSTLIANGINDQKTLEKNQDEILNSSDKYLHVNDHFQFMRLTESMRSPQLTFLEWSDPPQTTALAGEKFRTFSVTADEGVTDRVKLEEKLENQLHPTTVLMRDLEPIQGYSLVDFSDYTIKYPGRYKIRVVSVETPHIHTSWQDIVVGATSSYSSKLNTGVDEHLYLSSTARLSNITIIDKDYTFLSQTKPTTTLTAEKDNRAFITTVYESESEDTDDDTYLTLFKSTEDSPCYFPLTRMSRTTTNSHNNYPEEEQYKPDHYTQTKSIDYYDHTTHTTDDSDDDSDSLCRSKYRSRQDKFLTPTKYRDENRPPLSSLFPKNNGDEQSDNDDNIAIIIPTKYRLLQKRQEKLLNDEKENRSEHNLQANRYDSQDKLNRDRSSSQRDKPSPQRYQSPINRPQNQDVSDDDTLQQQRQSTHHHSGTPLQNRKDPVNEPPSHHHSRTNTQSEFQSPSRLTSRKQSDVVSPPRSPFKKQSDSVTPPRLTSRKQSDVVSPPRSPFKKQSDSVTPPRLTSRKQSDVVSPPRSPFKKQSDSVTPPRLTSRKQSDSVTPPRSPSKKQTDSNHDASQSSPHYNNKQISSNQKNESDEEFDVKQPQQQSSINNIDQNHLKPLYNQYRIISGNIELKENPSDNKLYTHEPKNTQVQLIFQATVQGLEVQRRAEDYIHGLANNQNHTQLAGNVDQHEPDTTNVTSDDDNDYQERPNSGLDSTSKKNRSSIAATKTDHQDKTSSHRPGSQQSPPSPTSYVKTYPKSNNNLHGSTLPSSPSPPGTPPKPTVHTKPYFFGENVQNQLSDEENDEHECVAFGFNSQLNPIPNTSARRSPDYPSSPNPRISNKNENYSYSSNPQFGQQSDVGTTTRSSLTQPQTFTSNNRTSKQNGYEKPGTHTPTNNYNNKNQTNINTQYHGDSDQYDSNIGNYQNQQPTSVYANQQPTSIYANQQPTSNNFDPDTDDDDNPRPLDSNSHLHDEFNDDQDQVEDEPDINDQTHDSQEEDNNYTDVNDHDRNSTNDEDDTISVPHQSGVGGVGALITQNPVRNTSANPQPLQYPRTNSDVTSDSNVPAAPKKKPSFFSKLFSSSSKKDVDKTKKKPSTQKPNNKKDTSRSTKNQKKR